MKKKPSAKRRRLIAGLGAGCCFLLSGAACFMPLPAGAATLLTPIQERELSEAGRLLDEGKNTAAREILDALRKRKEAQDSPGFHVLDGRSVVRELPVRARDSALRALGLDARNKDALDLLSLAYAVRRSGGLDKSTEVTLLELEVGDYERVLMENPGWPDLLFRCASQRIALHRLAPERKEELELAVVQLREVLESMDENAPLAERTSAHHQLGRALKHQGDQSLSEGERDAAAGVFAKAIGEFDRALDLDPDRVDSLGEIVLIERAQGNAAEAVASIGVRIGRMKKPAARAKAREMAGALHLELGDAEEAFAELEMALAEDEGSPGSYLTLYRLYLGSGESEKAEEVMERGLTEVPNFLEGHVYLGQFFMQRSRPEEAIAAFEAALRIPRERAVMIAMAPSPNLARNRFYYHAASSLAWLYLDAREDALKARDAVHLAQKFQKADPHLLDTAGWIYHQVGDHGKAVETLKEAIAQSGGFAAAHYHLAESYAALGQEAQALGELDKAFSAGEEFAEKKEAVELRRRLRGEGGN